METKFMTPTEIWENFNPVKEPLETYIEKCQEKNGYLETEMFFTSETVQDGKVRVYLKMLTNPQWNEKHPAIMVLANLSEKTNLEEMFQIMLNNGYVVFFIDYAGFASLEKHTSFPKSLEYASYDIAKNNLRYMGESARVTPWFVWSKIARRAITLISEQNLVDAEKINLLGYLHGAQLAWIVGAIDGRINALLPVMGHGYTTYGHGESSLIDSEEDRTWVSGICPENYARFVACPVLYTTSTNCYFANIDKVGDFIASIPSTHKNLCISPKTNYQIDKDNFLGMLKWTNYAFKGNPLTLPTPTLSIKVEDNILKLYLSSTETIISAEAFISYDNTIAPIRDWFTLEGVKHSENEFSYDVLPYDNCEKVFAFANVVYKSGVMVSTPIITATAEKYEGCQTVPAIVENNRIVYTNKKGLGSFSIESFSFTIDDNDLKLAEGPFKIKGIMAENGYLVTNKLMKSKFANQKDSLLKIDFYSPHPRDIRIQLYSFEKNTSYVAKCFIKGGQRWQKVLLSPQDFKTEDGKPLNLFSDTQITIFKNIAGVILNNIIWI